MKSFREWNTEPPVSVSYEQHIHTSISNNSVFITSEISLTKARKCNIDLLTRLLLQNVRSGAELFCPKLPNLVGVLSFKHIRSFWANTNCNSVNR